MTWMILLALQGTADDDAAAARRLSEFREKIRSAESVRVEYVLEVSRAGNVQGTVRGTLLLKGKGRWKKTIDADQAVSGEDMSLVVLSDGRTVRTGEAKRKPLLATFSPEQGGRELRQSLGTSLVSVFFYSQPAEAAEFLKSFGDVVLEDVKDGGTEDVGDVKARVITFGLKYQGGPFGDRPMSMKLLLDPETGIPLRREMDFMGSQLKTTFSSFAFDEEIPDGEFKFQTAARLARARAIQVARSVDLFTKYTGRLPVSLDELVSRPADLREDVFWPEGGFVLGKAVPRDPWGRDFVVKTVDGEPSVGTLGSDGKGGPDSAGVELQKPTSQAVGAPTPRLRDHYTARVTVQLMAAAVEAYKSAYGELPRKKAVLWERPEWAEIWPEGGWIPGGVPKDPWGRPYRMISDKGYVRVMVSDYREKSVKARELTAGERAALEETAQPKLGEADRKRLERAIRDLADDDLAARDDAAGVIAEMGLRAVPVLDRRLESVRDPERRARLRQIRGSIRIPTPAWRKELTSLSRYVRVQGHTGFRGQRASNERNASASLKTLCTAQYDFRANDRDGNGVNDFWTGDVAGLYTMTSAVTRGNKDGPIKLIELSVALADAKPLERGAGGENSDLSAYGERSSKAGYLFQAMKRDGSTTPPTEYGQNTGGALDQGEVHHASKFGFCAYPEEYGEGSMRTYIVNESNTLFWKDTDGEPVLEWPTDEELQAEWSKLD